MPEGFLRLHAVLAAHSAVDGHDGFLVAQESGDAGREIIERVAMLGEDN